MIAEEEVGSREDFKSWEIKTCFYAEEKIW